MVKAEDNSSAFLYFTSGMIKNAFYILILGVFIYSCATTKDRKVANYFDHDKNDTIRIANDSLEYEIIIIEPGFNTWVVTQRPRGYYSESFLEVRNQMYVAEYNRRVLNPQLFNPDLYIQQINYDYHTHYGYEVNYLLFNYFIFFEQRFNQRLLAGGRNRTF